MSTDTLKACLRALALPFDKFLLSACDGSIAAGTYVTKYDGFRLNIREVDGCVAYFSKGGHRIWVSDRPSNMMEAIVLFMSVNFPELAPSNVLWMDRKPVEELNVEFVASRKSDPLGTPYLKGLFLKECLDPSTGRLNETDFVYFPVVFDCRVHRGGSDPAFYKRVHTIRESLVEAFHASQTSHKWYDSVPEQICDPRHLMEVLLREEGVVVHSANGLRKIKIPKVVLKARIVAVGNALPEFAGFTHFLMAVPDGNAGWRVVHALDWTPLFSDYTRVQAGRPFVNPRSVKEVNKQVICTSGSSLQPLVDALFRAVSGVKRSPPVTATKTTAVVRCAGSLTTLKCGSDRSFSFESAEFEFLFEPLDVVLGAVELWELGSGEIHLQPAWLLAFNGYGNEAYMQMKEYTSMHTLRTIAGGRMDPNRIYDLVGMPTGPFLGLEAQIIKGMGSAKFFV